MRQGSDGRDTVFPWSYAPPFETDTHAVGDTVYSGSSRGTVVHVSTVVAPLVSVEWDDGKDKYGAIVYPMNAPFLRKAFPWE